MAITLPTRARTRAFTVVFVTAVLSALATFARAKADPVLPLPRLPICGQVVGGSTIPPVFNCPSFTILPDVQMFQVPGAGPKQLTFNFGATNLGTSFKDEAGLLKVDDVNGTVDGIAPGEPGYLAAAFTRAIIFYPRGSTGASPNYNLNVNGGDILVFFLVQNDTLANLQAKNPNNLMSTYPHAFFSLDVLNGDKHDHFVGFRDEVNHLTQFGFEDLDNGGDNSYDDVVININSLSGNLTPLPLAVSRTIVLVNDLGSRGDCKLASDWLGSYLQSPAFKMTFGGVTIDNVVNFNYKSGALYACPAPSTEYTANDTCTSIAAAAANLKQAIDGGAKAKTTIVAHGSGGLVAASLVAQYPDWAKTHLAGVVTVDSPLRGVANPQQWSTAFYGSACLGAPGLAPALSELDQTSTTVGDASKAAMLAPFYSFDAVLQEDNQQQVVERDRSRLNGAHFLHFANRCTVAGASAGSCEPPIAVADNHSSAWASRYSTTNEDKAFLIGCAVINATDCSVSNVTVPPDPVGQGSTAITTATVNVAGGITRIRFSITSDSSIQARIIGPDGIVYGPAGSGPIAGYSIHVGLEVYEIVNPAPGFWKVELTDLAAPSAGASAQVFTAALGRTTTSDRIGPQAALEAATAVCVNKATTLSAIKSYDPDGAILTYEWDLDGDGVFELSTKEAWVNHTFTNLGSATVRLRVTDNGGMQSEVQSTIQIIPVSVYMPITIR